MDATKVGDALPRRGNLLSRIIANSILSLFGWHIEAEIPNIAKAVIVGAPHTSNWDFILTMLTQFALSIKISWMAKHSFFRWPFVGFLKWLGGVPIDRTKDKDGNVIQIIEEFNRREKFIIAVMPEGTRSKTRQWKTGFYHIAQGADVPIVLVRFDYGRKVMGIGPAIDLTGDITADVTYIQSIFAPIKGKHPFKGVSESGSEVGLNNS